MNNGPPVRREPIRRLVLGIIDLLELLIVRLRELARELGAKDKCEGEE